MVQYGGMPYYSGSTRRQMGGALFGTGWREAVPKFFRNLFNSLKPHAINVGKHALRAGANAATDLLDSDFKSNAKDVIRKRANEEMRAFKRKYEKVAEDKLPLLDNMEIDPNYLPPEGKELVQSGSGMNPPAAKRRKVINKNRKPRKTKSHTTKKPATKRKSPPKQQKKGRPRKTKQTKKQTKRKTQKKKPTKRKQKVTSYI